MALLQHFNYFHSGQTYSYSYSPKWLNRLSVYDRSPLALFVHYDNIYGLISAINLHWLTVAQRAHLLDTMTRVFPINDLKEWGKAVNINWQFITSLGPVYKMAWRRYFPNRIRNIKTVASTWDYEEIKKDVIMSNTQKVIGVTPEYVQNFYAESMARKLRGQAQKSRQTQQQVQKNLNQHIVW
jgi:hypothetical protein